MVPSPNPLVVNGLATLTTTVYNAGDTDARRELLERLEPTARTLGCTRELAGITDILDAGAGYQRMRAAAEADGSIDLQAAVRPAVAVTADG